MIVNASLVVLICAANLLAMNQMSHERVAQLPERRPSSPAVASYSQFSEPKKNASVTVPDCLFFGCTSYASPATSLAKSPANPADDFLGLPFEPAAAGAPDAAPATYASNRLDSDDGKVNPQEARPVPVTAFAPIAPVNVAPAQEETKVQWWPLARASLRYLAVMHAFRIATEAGTRDGLTNPFWSGYLDALGAMHGWSDGDGYYENYLGHPIQGAVSAYIWIHNDPRYRNVEFGKDPNYWKGRLRAYAFAWAFSAQFEVGLLSEASIGQIQSGCCQYGFVDHVITPNAGLAWVVGEDIIDKYVVRRIEDKTHRLGLRIAARIALNPTQSFANLMNWEYPWYRENRDAPSRYEGAISKGLVATRAQPPQKAITYPLVPKFEFTATLPSVMSIGGLSCLGGGGIAGFRLSNSWQWTAEVSGCTVGDSLPQYWSGDSLTFTSGPQWIRHSLNHWTPHAHVRLGGQKITEQYMNEAKREAIAASLPPGKKLNPYYNDFTSNFESTGLSLSLGGGVDYRLNAALALRVANLEYIRSWLNPVVGTDFNRGIRFTTGVVLRLGTW